MEASNSNVVAPFVMKTYQMVSDPMTDALISWGPANNTFIVADPLDFSQRILPAYFKHSNFSSFVRQLNTYGFRKVDPDRWEFANECFLRGQRQLLNNIVRKKHGRSNYPVAHRRGEGDDEAIVTEIARLKQEQRSLEEDLEGMSRRLEATERRPQQMMAFLYKVAEDPQLLPRLMLEKERAKALTQKKRRLITSSPSGAAVTNSVKSEEEEVEVEDDTAMGVISSFSSPETNFDGNTFRPSPDTPSAAWLNRRQARGQPLIDQEASDCTAVPRLAPVASAAAMSGLSTASPAMMGCDSSGDGRAYLEGLGAVMGGSPPPYPFSLLGGGF